MYYGYALLKARCSTVLLSCISHSPVPNGSPQNIIATDLLSRSVTLTWNPPLPEYQNGNITAYFINATVVGSEEMFQLVSPFTILEIDTLTPYTTYSILIAASTVVGSGPFSTVLTIQTPQDGKWSCYSANYVLLMH